jgi:hypothetical protein
MFISTALVPAALPPPDPATDGMEVFPPTWRSDGLYDDSFYPFIDKFGQYIHLNWPDKVIDDNNLVARYEHERGDLDLLKPGHFNQYGGWKNGPKLEATGFFRTVRLGDVWWLVDPEGCLFLSSGVTTVGSVVRADAGGSSALRTGLSGRENFFQWLPPGNHPGRLLGLVANETATVTSGDYRGQRPLAANFFALNALAQYPQAASIQDLRSWSSTLAFQRLRSWGFTTIGAWSDPDLFTRSGRRPYTHMLQPAHPGLINGSTTYLDYFKDQWLINLRARLTEEIGLTIGDPYNLGFYIDNERDWTKSNVSARSLGLWVLKAPSEPFSARYAKRAFRDQLRGKYVTIANLNSQWQVNYSSWDDVLTRQDVEPTAALSDEDMQAFERLYAETYFSTCRQAMREIAPRHLYLGCRFTSGARPVLLELAAKFADVVTVNLYGQAARLLPGMEVGSDGPLMCTEYHYTARDTGLFADAVAANSRRITQTERAQAMKTFARSFSVHPRYVGTHWFQYFDYPPSGRLDSRNMNSNLGFVSTANLTYAEMAKGAREMNYAMYRERFSPGGLTAAADASARKDVLTEVSGLGTLLEVSGAREAYLRFNLASLTTAIERAILLLTPVEGDPQATHSAMVAEDTGWAEASSFWISRPAVSGETLAWTTTPGLAVELDVTTQVRAARLRGESLVFRIASADGTALRYASREYGTHSMRPQILILSGPGTFEAWREQYFLRDSQSSGHLDDPDRDGLPNLCEYAFGSSPHEANTTDGMVWEVGRDGVFRCSFYRARADLEYTLESSPDCVEWTPVVTNPGTAGGPVNLEFPTTERSRFFRLRISQ